jgi:hypothetical protein
MQRNMPRREALASALATALLLAGCNSPTLPLPPPSSPNVELRNGTVIVWGPPGAVTPSAQVICFNHATGDGRWSDADVEGAYTIVIPGKRGDALELWQRVGNHSSPSVSVVVR